MMINVSSSTITGAAIRNPIVDTYMNRLRIEFNSINTEFELVRMDNLIQKHIMPEIIKSMGVMFNYTQKTLAETMLLQACAAAGVRIYLARPNGVALAVPLVKR